MCVCGGTRAVTNVITLSVVLRGGRGQQEDGGYQGMPRLSAAGLFSVVIVGKDKCMFMLDF